MIGICVQKFGEESRGRVSPSLHDPSLPLCIPSFLSGCETMAGNICDYWVIMAEPETSGTPTSCSSPQLVVDVHLPPMTSALSL